MKKSELLNALTQVKPGLAKNDLIEGANNFIFTKSSIITYNDTIQVQVEFKSGIEGTAPSQELYNLLSKIPDDEIEIENNKSYIVIKGNKKKAKFIISEIPEVLREYFVDSKKLKSWSGLPKDFSECLKFCLFSSIKDILDSSKAVLSCLNINRDTVESSDNNRATTKKMNDKVNENLLIPSDSVRELIKYSPIKFCKTKGWINFKNKDGVIFSTRTIEGEFPDISKYMKVKGTKVKLPNNMDKIIQCAEVLSDEDHMINLHFQRGKLICSGEGPNGRYEEESRIVYRGEELTIRVDPQFLIQALPLIREITLSENRLLFEGNGFSHIICVNG